MATDTQPLLRANLAAFELNVKADQTPANTLQCEYQLGGIPIDQWIGRPLELTWRSTLPCAECGSTGPRPAGKDYCFTCHSRLARCDLCVLSPDRCHFHEGTCREPDWGTQFCMQPHKVYLSWTSGPKVGITRADRLWRRWADQGAVCAIELAQVPTRRAAGVVEAALKNFVTDRTDWRRLVSQPRQVEEVGPSMLALAQRLRLECDELGSLSTDHLHTRLDLSERAAMSWVDPFKLQTLVYPGQSRTVAKRLQCQPENAFVQGRLIGAVGHFLLLDAGVVDVWSHASEQVAVTALDVNTNQIQDSHQDSLF